MTNRSLSWIDPDAWAALLVGARLTGRRETAVAERLASDRPAPPAPTFRPREWQPPPGSLAERLDSLVRWAVEVTGASSVFVADEGGLPVFTVQEDSTYLCASADLLALLKRVRRLVDTPTEGAVSLSLKGGRHLHFVEATTGSGVFGLGFVCGELLDEAHGGAGFTRAEPWGGAGGARRSTPPLDEARLEQLRAALRLAFRSD